MSKIKFILHEFEKALAFQILEMDERFRGLKGFGVTIKGYEGKYFNIKSSDCLYFHREVKDIYLRGHEKHNDLSAKIIYFDSNKERNDFKKKMLHDLELWADNWEGWKEKKEIKENGIYEF